MEIVLLIIGAAAFADVGYLFGRARSAAEIDRLRIRIDQQVTDLRLRGRELGHLRAAELARQDQRKAAAQKAGAAAKARAEAKRAEAKPSTVTPIRKRAGARKS